MSIGYFPSLPTLIGAQKNRKSFGRGYRLPGGSKAPNRSVILNCIKSQAPNAGVTLRQPMSLHFTLSPATVMRGSAYAL